MASKQTERETDWQDIALLDEIQDARLLAKATSSDTIQNALSRLRSRRGFDRALSLGLFADAAPIKAAIASVEHPVPLSFLLPATAQATFRPGLIADHLTASLKNVEFGSQKHLALVEVVRRAHKRYAMEIDRLDKQSRLRH